MGLPSFNLSASTWNTTRGRNHPAEPEIIDLSVATLTEGNTRRISAYGTHLRHRFMFEDMPRADYDGGFNWATMTQTTGMSLVGFYYTVAEKQLNTFTFTDEDGNTHTVRFEDSVFSPSDPDHLYINVSFGLIEEL